MPQTVTHERVQHSIEALKAVVTERAKALAPHIGNISLLRRVTRPESYRQALEEVKDIPKWRRVHSRLAEYSERTGSFFFVQIGANDGVKGDPVRRHVQRYNWTGLLVEPVPHIFADLRRNYAGQRGLNFANVAITETDGVDTMFAAVQLPNGHTNPLSPISTFDPKIIEKHRWMADNPDDLTQPTEVQTRTLPSLLYEFGVEHIDGLFVDTEGYDKRVLDQLDLTTHAPNFILYEHGHLSPAENGELRDRFTTAGYELTTMRRDTFAELV